MGNDHSNSSNTLKIYTNVTKNHLQFLATPTSTTTDAMALKFLQTLSGDYKANFLKDVLIGSKLTEYLAIIWVAVIRINLKSSLIFVLIISHAYYMGKLSIL